VATYEGAVRAGIHALKYHGRTAVGVPLGALLAEAGGARLPAAPLALLDAIVPVPLHPARQAERGFNQAELLARACGRRWGLPVWPRALRRVRPTRPQTELDGAARRANVRGAFAVSWSAPVAGRRLLLVDDVLTTGATLGAAATALRAAGATLVGALVLARASGEDRTPSGRGAEAIRGSIMAEFSPSPVSGSPGTARGVDTHGTEGRSQRIRSDRPRVLPGGLGHPRSRGGGGQRPR
jgi:ComF family protein